MRTLPIFTCFFLLIAPVITPLMGQETAAVPKSWTEEINEASETLDVFLSNDETQPLKMVSVYKWSNRARPVLGDRLCLLYLNEGRPVASCKIYPTGRAIVYTPISFCDQPLVAKRMNRTVWTPPAAAIEYQEFRRATKTLAPSESKTKRSLQMKSLAREFTAKTGELEARRQSSVKELRLLPKPVFRYEIESEQAEVFDGAAFVFVANGGNPQLFLLIEAIRDGLHAKWRFGINRRTNDELQVLHKDKEVWSVDLVPNNQLRSTTPFHKIVVPNDRPAAAVNL